MKIYLQNKSGGQLSVDFFISKKLPRIQGKMLPGGSLDVGEIFTLDQLDLSAELQKWVADGMVDIVTESESLDIVQLSSLLTLSAQQVVAASATLAMGMATKTGTIKTAKAASITIGGAGESMSVDILKNGVSILTAAIVIDITTVAREAVLGVLDETQIQVVEGDFFEALLTYVAGAPTPISNVIAQIEITPA